MKKILLLAVSAFALNLGAQTIPNNDFELWTVHEDPGSTGIVVDSLESGYWESGNPMLITMPSLGQGLPKGFMYDTTFAYSGSHAAAMRTGFLNGLVATGNLFCGTIDESINGIAQVLQTYNPLAPARTGMPSNATPSRLRGYYFYQPATDYLQFNIQSQLNDSLFGTVDTCKIEVIVHRWNSSIMKRDTVAIGNFKSADSTTGFTPFTVDLNYNTAMAGDSISIMMLSSSRGTAFAGAAGSLLVVDSLYFEGDYLSVSNIKENEFLKVFAFQNSLYINGVLEEEKIVIHDLMGKVVLEKEIFKGSNKIFIDKKGVFVVSVIGKNKIVKTMKIKLN